MLNFKTKAMLFVVVYSSAFVIAFANGTMPNLGAGAPF